MNLLRSFILITAAQVPLLHRGKKRLRFSSTRRSSGSRRSVRTDGRAFAPLPAMWLDGALHFSTGLDEQKGRNLLRNPNCILTTGNNSYRQGLDVVVEGRAERVTDRPTLERLAELWQSKIGWPWDVAKDGFRPRPEGPQPENADTVAVVPVFAVRPSRILSFGRGERFTQTRYRL